MAVKALPKEARKVKGEQRRALSERGGRIRQAGKLMKRSLALDNVVRVDAQFAAGKHEPRKRGRACFG